MAMKFGERQVAKELKDIRRDHVARYEWVAKNLPPESLVIDLACGVGYGTNIMANAGHRVLGVDKDKDALEYAHKNWNHKNAQFGKVDAEGLHAKLGDFDAAVCFETIEHVSDPVPLLRSLRQSANCLIASVPNENVMPYIHEDGKTTAFHYRHYTPEEFELLLNVTGWEVAEWWGQEGPESEVVRDTMGRTIIAVCRPSRVVPEHVVILGFGPSLDEYTNIVKRCGKRQRFADETWAINSLGGIFDCDLVFHMDDVRIQEIRAKERPDSNIAAMLEWIKDSKVPIITSRAHPDYPALEEFPLEDVMNNLKYDYFNSTAAYAVAYAIHLGVKKISLFGVDYTYPNAHDAEKGRACVEFWLGRAAERGIKISVPKKSTLMDALHTQAERFYGYDTVNVSLHLVDDKIQVDFTEIEKLPTAEEIEAKYDHSSHPNSLVGDES